MFHPWITLLVYGKPEAKPRARATSIKGHGTRMYQPKTPKDWAGAVRATARDRRPETPTLDPVRVDISWHMPRPKSHFGTGRNAGLLKASAPHWHTSKPDRDNLDKAVLDVLTELGFWRDDCQVVAGTLRKRYTGHGEAPHALIELSFWREENAK